MNTMKLSTMKSILQSAVFSHVLCAKVGVAAGTVPVPWDRFGVKRHHHTEIFTDSVEDEASNPQMVPHVDTFTWPDLELPLKHKTQHSYCYYWLLSVQLYNYKTKKHFAVMTMQYLSWHDFSIGATDLNPSIQTSSVVGLHYVSPVSLVCSHCTVIWS